MNEEFTALQNQATWTLVPAPLNKPVLGCKWTYKTKLLPSGKVDRYKARLVALGYNQKFGINYTETFSPVAKMPTIRLLLTLALNRRCQILQLDVSNAFLHGDLPDDIYMRQPPGFQHPHHPDFVCKLRKSLYGLKQAPRQWFQKLTGFLQAQGFGFSRSDPSLLILNKDNIQIYILIYVDDFLVTGNNEPAITRLLTQLRSQFALKQLGDISLFLGIQVIRIVNPHYPQAPLRPNEQKPTGLSSRIQLCIEDLPVRCNISLSRGRTSPSPQMRFASTCNNHKIKTSKLSQDS
ncbi:hypothetical protein KFK09_013500 [Dendrobium nobile]|uniref:Reverse transcriptase Ty1/copia-type domain-containing protein n=1 Tax=Dendrobium nobile TaxID=94219 RepID=A0A8T3B7L1_DENNO|nr:hypothetical protein KFK09_013500 [Dendrobium nobile]